MEIRGTQPNQPFDPGASQPGSTGDVGKTQKASFGDAMNAGGAGAAGGASAAGATGGAAAGGNAAAAGGPAFAKIQDRIQQGVQAGQPKQEILQSLVSDHLREQYGDKASPQMTAAVTEQFQSDPQLSQLFNSLYARATQ